MKILIVEDETAAYENLADMILSLDSSIEIMGNTESVRQTVRGCKPIRNRICYLWIFICRMVPLSRSLIR